jgi:hypothetical protein
MIVAGEASPRPAGVTVGRDGIDFEPWDESGPYVCPGCYAVGSERCAPNCIDAEIEREREDDISRRWNDEDDGEIPF